MTQDRASLYTAAILAGGLATRLRPITASVPKALIEIGGEPFIAHQLRLLRTRGVSRVVICAAHLGELVRTYVGRGERFGVHVAYSFDGPQLLGTAGALRRAQPLLGDPFFVLYGDSYLPCSFREVQEAFVRSGKPALMTVYENAGRWDTSNVEFAAGRIVAYDKRLRTDRMRHIDYGLGVLATEALDLVPPGQPHDLADLYQELLKRDLLAGFEVRERFYEIGSLEGLAETRHVLASATGPSRSA